MQTKTHTHTHTRNHRETMTCYLSKFSNFSDHCNITIIIIIINNNNNSNNNNDYDDQSNISIPLTVYKSLEHDTDDAQLVLKFEEEAQDDTLPT